MTGFNTGEGSHPCVTAGCPNTVPYDDEPWCFTHSPDEGSSVPGYSYKTRHQGQQDPAINSGE